MWSPRSPPSCPRWSAKRELQALANALGIPITVCHLPPGTSKWNKIEHRLFSFVTQNWRGKPLVSLQTIVQLIAATTNETGLKVRCAIDPKTYPIPEPAGAMFGSRIVSVMIFHPVPDSKSRQWLDDMAP